MRNQDTQRRVIVSEVEEALDRLDLRRHLDNSPFTTGPRRSVALLYFGQRAGEQESDRKGRMHDVLQALLQAKPVTSHGKKMWVALSRSKQERDVSSHCSWRKRTLASFGQSHVDGLDVEYSSGTSWMGDHMVASSTRAPPVTGQDGDLVRDDRKVCRPWVHVALIAKITGISTVDLRSALDEYKR